MKDSIQPLGRVSECAECATYTFHAIVFLLQENMFTRIVGSCDGLLRSFVPSFLPSASPVHRLFIASIALHQHIQASSIERNLQAPFHSFYSAKLSSPLLLHSMINLVCSEFNLFSESSKRVTESDEWTLNS